jgi:anti-sigma regulatory factor (Ser/Thr protein kinase)
MHASELTVTLRNHRSEIARLTALLETFCRNHGVGEDDTLNVNLVLDEAVINVIAHGYEDAAEHEIDVRLLLEGRRLTIQVADDGISYNPLDAPAPRFDLPIEQRRIGGLGVHIMKALAETLDYRREDGRNHFTITMAVGRDASAVQPA